MAESMFTDLTEEEKKAVREQKGAAVLKAVDDVRSSVSKPVPPLAVTSENLPDVVPEKKVISKTPTAEGVKEGLKRSPEARQQFVNQFAESQGIRLKANQRDSIDKLLQDDTKLSKQMEKSDPGPSALFTTALLGFLPVLVGAAFGGAAGAEVGGKVGLGAIKQVADTTEANRKADLEERKFGLQEKQEDDLVKHRAEVEERTLGLGMADIALRKEELGLKKQQINEAKTGEKLTEGQAKAQQYSVDAEFQNSVLESEFNKLPPGRINELGGRAGIYIGDKLGTQATIPKDLQAFHSASNAFLEPILRNSSGGVISDVERGSRAKNLLPQPEDTPLQLKQKQIGRFLVIQGMKTAGRLGYDSAELQQILGQAKAEAQGGVRSRTPNIVSKDIWSSLSDDQKRAYMRGNK